MTFSSPQEAFFLASTSLIYLVSFLGFGLIVEHALNLKTRIRLPLLTLGFSVLLLLGGILTALHWVSLQLLFGLFAIGCTVGFLAFAKSIKNKSFQLCLAQGWLKKQPALALVTCVIILFFLFEVSNLYHTWFNVHDDFHGYLVFPIRLLHLGWFGFEPFSFRLLTSASGSHSFFLAYAFVLGNEDYFYFFELIVGFACFLDVLRWHSQLTKMPPPIFICIILGYILCWQHSINASSTFTSIPLFYALLVWSFQGRSKTQDTLAVTIKKSIAFLIMAACAITLKTTNIPPVFLVFGLYFTFAELASVHNFKKMVYFFIGLVVLIAPWCFTHYESTGTALFPFLGTGHQCFASATSISAGTKDAVTVTRLILSALFTFPLFQLLTAILLATFLINSQTSKNALKVWGLCFIWGIVVLAHRGPYQLGNEATYLRYATPFWLAALPIAINLCQPSRKFLTRNVSQTFNIIIALLIGAVPIYNNVLYHKQVLKMASKRPTKFDPSHLRPHVAQAQAAVPENATLWTHLSHPAFLDFKRNNVFVSDWPLTGLGKCEFLSDKPIHEFGAYFLKHQIHYLMYTYGNESGFQYSLYKDRLKSENKTWSTSAKKVFTLHEKLTEARQYYKVLYDDGLHFVLDLNQRAAP